MLTSRGGVLRWLAEIALVAAVVAAAMPAFARAQAKQDGDEAFWIGSSSFFLTLFVRHDLSADAWPDGYLTRTQPMIVRYLLGGWLTARGYNIESVSPIYDHSRKWFTNVELGTAPDEPMLREARLLMRGLAVVCTVLLYGVVRIAAGPVGGLAAALLLIGSPYFTLHLIRAKGDTILLMFMLASLLTGLVAIKRSDARGPSVRWGILTGLLLGLAMGAKLTAVLAMVAVVAWGVWAGWQSVGGFRGMQQLVRGNWRSLMTASQDAVSSPASRAAPDLSAPRLPLRLRWLFWAPGVVLLAYLTFIVCSPYLYPDPLGRTWIMFQNRQVEMAWEADVDPSRAITTPQQRIRLVWRWSLNEDTWGDYRLRWPIEAPLAVAGLAWLTFRLVRRGRGEHAWLLLWVVCIYAGVTWGLGYLLDHYFVPTAAMGLLLNGLVIGWSASWLWERARPALTRRGEATGRKKQLEAAQTETAIA